MRAFKVIPRKQTKQLELQFPQLKCSDCGLDDFNYDARVCVFDHFLDGDEANELLENISKEERNKRDLKWSALYKVLSQDFDVYMVKYRSEKLVFKAPRSAELLMTRLDKMESAGYVSFVIPALDLWYQQYWDDTHLICYQDAQKLQPIKDAIDKSGLFLLE
ncbi:hypothetical protein J8L98_11920 [Pseudoalteromonas sp. MMG013]|uniref:hypothetical protein n=1 Tax=Pseudoalteromonas sp. MMG013 TaxID=2822687 RepID=UPI001B38A9D4|nr:hypothetical protein [Pseudoalteromonas sp. MMG013]MBQ4862398.1 hypothetical protein [Pseudoalteromonas sp. MMG013]